MKIGIGNHPAAIIVALLALPWATSFILTEAGIRFDIATLLGEPPPRLPATAPSSDEYDPPPTWREHRYLAANPDVAAAVAAGAFSSGYEHYARIGQNEGRAFPSGGSKKTKPSTPVAAPPAPDPPVAEKPAETPPITPPPPTAAPPTPAAPPKAAAAVEPPSGKGEPDAAASSPPNAPAPEKTETPEPAPPPRKPPPPQQPAGPPPPPPTQPQPQPQPQPPQQRTATGATATVVDLRFGRHADFTRLVLDLTDRVDFKIEPAPDRRAVTIRLHNARWSAPPRRAGLQGLIVTGYEASPAGASEVRLTLQTTGPAVVVRANLLLPSEGRGHRLMIDLAAR